MGTNFYVDSRDRRGWHLGKRSAGWPFLFHADNDWPEHQAVERLAEILNTDGMVIKDEYGRKIPRADFLVMVYRSYEDSQLAHPGAFTDGTIQKWQFIRGYFC